MKKAFLIFSLSLVSTISFCQFYIGYNENQVRNIIAQTDADNNVSRDIVSDTVTCLSWFSKDLTIKHFVYFTKGISDMFNREYLEDDAFNAAIKYLNQTYTSAGNLAWKAYSKGYTYLILANNNRDHYNISCTIYPE